MNKNTILAIIIALLLFHAYGVVSRDSVYIPSFPDFPIINHPKPIPKPIEIKKYTLDEILNLITIEDVKKYVETLASKDFDGRGTGTSGNEKAADYICAHLDSLKIPFEKQSFTARGVNTSNIIAHITPPNITDDRVIVIGAHFDHLGSKGSVYYPGADDNASGTAGLMAIATALSKYQDKLKHTVVLQFYSAEEWGLIGSSYYTNNPLFPKDKPDINKHIAMINLDMIGYLRSKYEPSENVTSYRDDKSRIIYNYSLAIDLKNIVQKLSSKYTFANNISGYKPGGSDHAPFYNKRIPIVFLHTGSHSNYHRPSDTPDKLNYEGLVSVAKLAFEILLEIDSSN
jgi:Zn-dependent M28 family amino/carboxypeptidase